MLIEERRPSTGGFTLVEVLVALFLMSMALMAVALSFTMAINAIRDSREITTAMQVAQRTIEEMRDPDLTPFDSVQNGSFSVSPLNGTGTIQVSQVGSDVDLKKVVLTVNWESGTSRSMSKEIVTYIAREGVNRE